jgi:serine/threonine-protein kinase
MAASKQDARAIAEKRVGQTINNKFRIDRVIDMGGMAAVFAATHRNGKKVALKMLHPHIATNVDVRERFLREGYVANQVEHRGAVQVLDDDTTPDGAAFIVMELLDGESLEKWMARAPGGRVPAHEVLGVADQVLDVLGAFHERNVIHRDIKPANLFITREGVVKVLDFGLARLRDPRVSNYAPTGAGIVLGTVAYMPPEQAQGKSDEIDARTDIFAVGAVMFQAMTGKLFVKGETAIERLMHAMKDPAPPLAKYLPGVPDYVADVVDTALSFNKANRWSDAAEMRTAIRVAYAALVAEAKKRSVHPAAAEPTFVPERERVPQQAHDHGQQQYGQQQYAPQAHQPAAQPSPQPAQPTMQSARPKLEIVKEDSVLVLEGSMSADSLPPTSSEIPTLIRPSNAKLQTHAPLPVDLPPRTPNDSIDAIFDAVLQPSSVIDVSFPSSNPAPSPRPKGETGG